MVTEMRREAGAAAVEAAIALPLLLALMFACLQSAYAAMSSVSIESAAVQALSSPTVAALEGRSQGEIAEAVAGLVKDASLGLRKDGIEVADVSYRHYSEADEACLGHPSYPFDTYRRGDAYVEVSATVRYELPALISADFAPTGAVEKKLSGVQKVSGYVEVAQG